MRSKLDLAEHRLAGQSNLNRVGFITHLNSDNWARASLVTSRRREGTVKFALASNPKSPDIWLLSASSSMRGRRKELFFY